MPMYEYMLHECYVTANCEVYPLEIIDLLFVEMLFLRLPVGAVMMSKLLYNGAKPKLSEEFKGAKKTITLKDLSQWDYQTVKNLLL